MKILLLDQFSEPGGGQRMLIETLTAIRQRGWSAVVALPGDGEIVQRAADLGFPVERIDCGPFSSGTKSLADVAHFITGLLRLSRQIRSLALSADLVYINGPRLLPAAALANVRVPVLFHSHTALHGWPVRCLAGISLRRMRAQVIAVSRMVADCWRPFAGGARVSVIHNGVAGPGCVLLGPYAPPPRIGCIGRITREKGQREFLAAAAAIHRALPESRFFIYGAPLFSDRAAVRYEQDIRAEAAGLPVEFAGWVNDVYAALANLDILLVPSVWAEPAALVILEAFAAGVPVIGFRVGGIPEFVEDGLNGFLTSSAEEMARIAIDLIGNPARMAAISQAGRDTWRDHFTIERYRADALAAMERITAARCS